MKKIVVLLLFVFAEIPDVAAQNLPELLHDKLKTIQQRESIFGITASVMIGDNLIWSGTAGYSNPFEQDTVTVDMNAAIASITKMFTSSIILQLVEEGKLTLDQSIDSWIQPSDKVNGSITVKQLLNHTSGIADYTTDEWVDSFKVNPDRFWTTEDLIETFVHEPNFSPGSSWSYSNTNYFLLGEIIEQVESKSYRDVLYDRILIPQGLDLIYTPIVDTPTGPVMTPWFDIDDDGDQDNLLNYSIRGMHSSAWAAGYIHSTPAELAMFGYNLFNEKIISSESLDEMATTVLTGDDFEYGLGLMKLNLFGPDLYGHNGQYIGYNSILLYEPETETIVSLIVNMTETDINEIGGELAETVYNYVITGVNNNEQTAGSFELQQNYPNPFNPSTTIKYSIPNGGRSVIAPYNVRLVIYDVLGNEITTLVNETKSPGTYEIKFDASKLSSGIYFYTLTAAGTFTGTKKMILIK